MFLLVNSKMRSLVCSYFLNVGCNMYMLHPKIQAYFKIYNWQTILS